MSKEKAPASDAPDEALLEKRAGTRRRTIKSRTTRELLARLDPGDAKKLTKATARATNSRKLKALESTYTPELNDSWQRQERIWPESSLLERLHMLYDMVTRGGFIMNRKGTITSIQRFFGIKAETWDTDPSKDEYLRVMWMADTARVAQIDNNLITLGLLSDKDIIKMHTQNQYAYKVSAPAWEGVETVQQTPTIVFADAPKPDPAVRQNVEQYLKENVVQFQKKKD